MLWHLAAKLEYNLHRVNEHSFVPVKIYYFIAGSLKHISLNVLAYSCDMIVEDCWQSFFLTKFGQESYGIQKAIYACVFY